ncbi:MAG: hypothetical protein Q8O89_03765, partial [Nanoarchaeota archaeon]|nr:hypothetical protein [Nanoarchaeota archaeon]
MSNETMELDVPEFMKEIAYQRTKNAEAEKARQDSIAYAQKIEQSKQKIPSYLFLEDAARNTFDFLSDGNNAKRLAVPAFVLGASLFVYNVANRKSNHNNAKTHIESDMKETKDAANSETFGFSNSIFQKAAIHAANSVSVSIDNVAENKTHKTAAESPQDSGLEFKVVNPFENFTKDEMLVYNRMAPYLKTIKFAASVT